MLTNDTNKSINDSPKKNLCQLFRIFGIMRHSGNHNFRVKFELSSHGKNHSMSMQFEFDHHLMKNK